MSRLIQLIDWTADECGLEPAAIVRRDSCPDVRAAKRAVVRVARACGACPDHVVAFVFSIGEPRLREMNAEATATYRTDWAFRDLVDTLGERWEERFEPMDEVMRYYRPIGRKVLRELHA